MTPEEAQQFQEHINEIAKILYKNTPKSNLVFLESIEKSVCQQILEEVGPPRAFFLSNKLQELQRGEREN